jgi:hypothetical protein
MFQKSFPRLNRLIEKNIYLKNSINEPSPPKHQVMVLFYKFGRYGNEALVDNIATFFGISTRLL